MPILIDKTIWYHQLQKSITLKRKTYTNEKSHILYATFIGEDLKSKAVI